MFLKQIKCNIKKCKAECCCWIKFNIEFIEKHQNKLVRPIYACIKEDEDEPFINLLTYIEKRFNEKGEEYLYIDKQKQICPFLTEDYKCNIYHIRPEICKCFGTKLSEDHPFTCHYHLGKNYHFPKEDTEEYKKINNLKYMNEFINNKKLIKELGFDKN